MGAPAGPYQVFSERALQVDLLAPSMTVKVTSGGTVYYADNPYVNATTNQGSIANGASQTFTTGVWVRSASLSSITVQQVADTPQDVQLGSDGAVGGPGGTALTSSVVNGVSQRFDARNYGTVDLTGVADSSAAVIAALAAIYSAGGGTLALPPGKILLSSALAIPNDGQTSPTQPAIRITGAGPNWGGGKGAATQLVLGYNGGGPAKIDTRGVGYLEVDHLQFVAKAGSETVPILQTTNTTLNVHDCSFWGDSAKSGATCITDAIVLGGGDTTPAGQGGATQVFQGYGTVIAGNYFGRIRRALTLRGYANANVIRDNHIDLTCGSGTAGDAPIMLITSIGVDGITGNKIRDNLMEIGAYTYGVWAQNANGNLISGTTPYDEGGATAFVHLDSGCHQNTVEYHGWAALSFTILSDTSGNLNTLVDWVHSKLSVGANEFTFDGYFLFTHDIYGEGIIGIQPGGAGNPTINLETYVGAGSLGSGPGGGSVVDTHLYRYGPKVWRYTGNLQGPIGNPTYGPTVTPDATASPWNTITVTNGTAFTVAAATAWFIGVHTETQEMVIEVYNNSGGAMGAITWNATYVFGGFAWANPANGKKRWAKFQYNGFDWICTGVATADY